MRKELRIRNQMTELEKVNQFIGEISEELGLSMELTMDLNLVIEEMVVNVISYAYPQGTDAEIELLVTSDGKELTLVLSDQGREFDPTMKQDSDMSVNPAERELGGMGTVQRGVGTVRFQESGSVLSQTGRHEDH